MCLVVSKTKSGENIFSTLYDCFLYVNQVGYKGTIFVEKGVYKEKIKTVLKHVTIIGEGHVIFTYDDWAGKLDSRKHIIGTSDSASFTLKEESCDVNFENITFENTFIDSGEYAHKQAVAYKGLGDRMTYRNCRFVGKQDTLYLDEGRHHFIDCFIQGTVDFIFGGGVALFENCIIQSLVRDDCPLGYITAARTNHNIKTNKHPYGFVFMNCKLVSDINKTFKEENKVYLGRPWRKSPSVIFMYCYLGSHISKLGWCDMKENRYQEARFFEYGNYGEGSKKHQRRKLLTMQEANRINFNTIFNHDSFFRKWEKDGV